MKILTGTELNAVFRETMYGREARGESTPMCWEEYREADTFFDALNQIMELEDELVVGINLTPHPIALNDGRVFNPSGDVARVSVSFAEPDGDVSEQVFGEVYYLPEPMPGLVYIVSALVLGALNGSRPDVVAPATGHPDTVRNEKGHIVSVPCFTR